MGGFIMGKNLQYKILSAILTIGVLSANSTVFANSGGTVDNEGDYVGNNSPSNSTIYIDNGYKGNVYGGKADSGEIINNKIFISGGTITGDVYGGKVGSNGSVKNNYISIDNSTILGTVRVGDAGEVTDNEVNISNSTIGSKNDPIYFASGTSNVSNNVVNIISGTVIGSNICIGFSPSLMGTVENNELNISGGKIIGSIRAGTAIIGIVKDNTIKISGTANIEEAELVGTPSSNSLGKNNNNNLTIYGWSGNTQSVQNFNNINFENIKWSNGGTVLNITDNAEENSLANTNIKLNKLNFSGGAELKAGDSMTFVNGENLGIGKGNGKVTVGDKFTAGVATVGSGAIEVDENSVKYTLTEVKQNSQVNLVAENRAVAAAFVNQGTDLISDSLDTISRDSNYGVKTFAAVHGNRSKYDVNSDIKINGWSTIVGVGNADKFDNGSEFSWAVFYENGSGNYRTYNEFNNDFFRGDGSLVYNGGGIAARYTNKNGVYTEGSLRAGMLKSDMDNALRDGAGNFYGYESESAYYGAHIGIGKIISLSESSDLDVYGKFFHTYTEGDSFKVANDEFEFDSINSDRLRIGARITSNKENKFSTYYGLAYEYEFNGDADMTAQGLKAPTQSLQGSSVMAEIGFNYQPTPDSPWSFDLNMRGYTGERQGGSFNVQATYTF
jgi:hypothetical protein